MTIEKTWDFAELKDKAIEYIYSIKADNFEKAPTLPETMQAGHLLSKTTCQIDGVHGYNTIPKTSGTGRGYYTQRKASNNTMTRFGSSIVGTMKSVSVPEYRSHGEGAKNTNRGNQWEYGADMPAAPDHTNDWKDIVFNVEFTTDQTIPASLLTAKSKTTIKNQFEQMLKSRKLTEDDLKGKVVSIRTVQALIESMVQFIASRYQIWTDPEGVNSLLLYNDGAAKYDSISYNYSIVDASDKLTKDGMDELMSSIYLSALDTIKVKRQGLATAFTCSSSSSSSSSSCSSSCSSSSCSSSCSSSSSSVFIAYMSLNR